MEIQTVTGSGSDYATCMLSLAHQIAELRKDIGDVECGVKESILAQSLTNGQEFCAINKNISDFGNRNVIEIMQNRFELQKTESTLNNKIALEAGLIKTDLNQFQRSVDHQICEVKGLIKDTTAAILKQLSDDKLDEKNDTIAQLRAERNRLEDRMVIGNEITNLRNMIQSTWQDQRFSSTSKTVQFGAGNVAIPTNAQTANQG